MDDDVLDKRASDRTSRAEDTRPRVELGRSRGDFVPRHNPRSGARPKAKAPPSRNTSRLRPTLATGQHVRTRNAPGGTRARRRGGPGRGERGAGSIADRDKDLVGMERRRPVLNRRRHRGERLRRRRRLRGSGPGAVARRRPRRRLRVLPAGRGSPSRRQPPPSAGSASRELPQGPALIDDVTGDAINLGVAGLLLQRVRRPLERLRT